MIRKIASVILLLVLCGCLTMGVCATVDETFIYDKADLLSSAEEIALTEKLQTISHTYNAQIVICVYDTLGGDDMDLYDDYVYDTAQFGYGENRDGVMLLVCMDVREFRILSNGFAGVAIDADTIDAMGEAFISDLSDGYYADAFHTFADQCAYYLDGYLNGFPFDFGGTLGICLIIGIVVGVIVVLILKGQLKSVRKQNRADVYVKPGSMQITVHNDLFLYRTVSRTKKASSSGSSRSGGGSSRSSGGGSF